MFLIIMTMVPSAIVGAIVGLIWWLALGTITALYIATICGAALGIPIALMGIAASSRGNVTEDESLFVSGSMMMLAGMLAGIIGLVVWLVRVIID